MSDKRYDQPGRTGLGKFASLNFALENNEPSEASADPKDSRSDATTPHPRGPEAFSRLISPIYLSPEQGLIATAVGTVILVASIGFWLFIYIRNADEFRVHGASSGPSQAQIARDRAASHRLRINP